MSALASLLFPRSETQMTPDREVMPSLEMTPHIAGRSSMKGGRAQNTSKERDMTHLIALGAERIKAVQRIVTRTVGAAVLIGAAAVAGGDDGSMELQPLVRPDGAQVVLTIDGIDYAAFGGDENLILVADDGATITVPPDAWIPCLTGTLPELTAMWGTTLDDLIPGSVDDAVRMLRERAERGVDPGGSVDDVLRG